MRKSARLPLEALAPCLLEVPRPDFGLPSPATPQIDTISQRLPVWRGAQPLSWSEVFGNEQPVEVEVGFGKGLFLLQASGTRPDVNFLGIEIERAYCLLAATRLVKAGRKNVRLVCADARWFLREWVQAASVHTLHVYFPDPWWKNRHRKRRVFTAEFTQEAARVLCAGGSLSFATDVAEYFEETRRLVQSCDSLVERSAVEPATPRHDLDYLTHFERKYRQQNRPIYRALWEKK